MFVPYIYYLVNKNYKKLSKKFINNLELDTGKKFNFFIDQSKNYLIRKSIGNDIENRSYINFLNKKKIPKDLNFYNLVDLNKRNSFKHFMKNHLLKRDLPITLHTEDHLSMSCSIESRAPFVEHKLVEHVFSQNWKYFMKNGQSKYMLRSIRQLLGNSFTSKKKKPRPGDPSIIIIKFYTTIFTNLIKKINIENFNNKKILSQFLLDIQKLNYENFEFYFRVLNYLIWKNSLKTLISK